MYAWESLGSSNILIQKLHVEKIYYIGIKQYYKWNLKRRNNPIILTKMKQREEEEKNEQREEGTSKVILHIRKNQTEKSERKLEQARGKECVSRI